MRKSFLFLFLWILLTMPIVAWSETVQIYQKPLSDKQALTITRTQVPKDKPTPQQAVETAKWLKDNPGVSLVSSDHAYLYAYQLNSANGKQHKVLWTDKEETFGEAALPGQTREGSMTVEVLDVALESDGTLIAVYKQDRFATANIIRTARHGRQTQLAWPDRTLAMPVSGLDGRIVSAKISGSLKSNTLQVQFTSYTKKTFTFQWQGRHWQLMPDQPPAALNEKGLGPTP